MISRMFVPVVLALLFTAATIPAVDFTANTLPGDVRCQVANNGTVRLDKRGIWNVWPNYTGITVTNIGNGELPTKIDIGFSPADTFNTWLDGHLFSLLDADGRELLRLDMVRRGRFRLTTAGKSAISLPVKWSPAVVHYDNLKPDTLTILITGRESALVFGEKCLVRLPAVPAGNGPFTAKLGRLGDHNRGALGWYSRLTFTADAKVAILPPDAPLPGEPRFSSRVKALNDFFFDCLRNPVDAYQPGTVNIAAARRAAGRLAVDSLWYRLHNNRTACFEIFLNDTEALMQEIIAKPEPQEKIQFNPQSDAAYFLAPDESDFYGGVCGWGMGAYAPELALMGINLTAEHVWPAASSNNQGKFDDVMLIRRIMPGLEEYEKYGIRFDLMVAPYTPPWLLKKHPEWDGAFIGYGMEGEKEGIDRHNLQWSGRQAGHGFLKASVIAEDYRAMCVDFMKNVLPIVASSKALVAIDLANEVQLEDYSPEMQRRFREYLVGKYGSIDNLNRAWNSRHTGFDGIMMLRPAVFSRNNGQRFMDWVNFNKQIGTEHFRFLCDLARKYAPGVPLHIKTLPYEFGMPWMEPGSNSRNFYDYADGVDRKTFSTMTEIIGTDSWADNPHDRYGRLATDLPYQSAYFSLLKGYNPDKWIFDSEWHILRTDPPVTPPQCLDMVMTQNFVQGLRAGTFWVACPGIDQKLDLTSQPRLLMQAGLTTARLRSQSAYYDVLARRKRPVAILYSPRSRYLDGDRHVNSLLRLSEAALFAGVSYRLVDERDLPALSPGEVPMLLVPECHAPENGTASALRNYAALGGTVVLTGTSPLQGNGDSSPFRILPLPENPVAILPLLNQLYQEVHLIPEIEITGENGKPIFGIQWHAVPDKNGGHIIYAANMTGQNRVLHIKNAGKLLDLRNGKHIPATIKLNTWETFLGSSSR